MQERCRQRIWPHEQPALPIHVSGSASSGSSQLVGGVPLVPEAQDGVVEPETPRVNAARLHADDKPKLDLLQEEEEEGGSPPSSPECPGGADSNDYLTASKSGEGCRHRRCLVGRKETGTGKIESTHISFHGCQC